MEHQKSISDHELLGISGLKWLPWIGERFAALPAEKRLLIVGESHYHDETPASIQKHESPRFTQKVIEEMAIERSYYNTQIFPNLHKALFGNDSFDSHIFWHLIAFYNFIQRPMSTNKGRPKNKDFADSWPLFLQLIEKFQPKTCLFIGTSAANTMEKALASSTYSSTGIRCEQKISNAYAKTATIVNANCNETKLIFIRHTSQMFSWSRWHEYLKNVMSNKLEWFSEQVNPTHLANVK